MSAPFSAWMSKALSLPRLDAYARAANGDALAAERLYWWNVQISGAFYGPLHCLEVALRNALHDELRSSYARDDWWTVLSNNRHSQYDRRLWVPCLHRAFPHYRGRRRDLYDNLETMRLFRNRIMHHEHRGSEIAMPDPDERTLISRAEVAHRTSARGKRPGRAASLSRALTRQVAGIIVKSATSLGVRPGSNSPRPWSTEMTFAIRSSETEPIGACEEVT